ncbi:polysaccharide biosynthesis protein [Candidatus Pelagibacter sp. HIMB1782]|uniref:polysaccharide biosynthesis protein n=1 Tax=Candidatus Pelagibacter sp. HIMB1782 TaxID=3413375 RepID=UPI003F871709
MQPKKIFLTGGTGTFGQGFVEYLLKKKFTKKIVIFSRDELKQSEMKKKFQIHKNKLRFLIGDIRDKDRVLNCLADCDTVVHAAALKRLEVCEENPTEAIKTNINGSENIINSSLENNYIKKIILVSTDKAVNPINLYGSTKLSAEKLFLSANNMKGPRKKMFSVVRYGNVINSRGSVIPYFLKLIELNKKILPLTDERMTRFIININQALNFVYNSLKIMKGNEIFVPKLPSVRISDIISALNCKPRLLGKGKGEKLHEVLISMEEKYYAKEHKNYFVINSNHKNQFIKKFLDYDSGSNKNFLNRDQITSLLRNLMKNENNKI